MAIVKALTIIPKGDKLTIMSDSMYALQGIIESLIKWEDQASQCYSELNRNRVN